MTNYSYQEEQWQIGADNQTLILLTGRRKMQLLYVAKMHVLFCIILGGGEV